MKKKYLIYLLVIFSGLFLISSCYNNPPFPSLENTTWKGTNDGQGRYLIASFGVTDCEINVYRIDPDTGTEELIMGGLGEYTFQNGYNAKISFDDKLSGREKIKASMNYDNQRFYLVLDGKYAYPMTQIFPEQ